MARKRTPYPLAPRVVELPTDQFLALTREPLYDQRGRPELGSPVGDPLKAEVEDIRRKEEARLLVSMDYGDMELRTIAQRASVDGDWDKFRGANTGRRPQYETVWDTVNSKARHAIALQGLEDGRAAEAAAAKRRGGFYAHGNWKLGKPGPNPPIDPSLFIPEGKAAREVWEQRFKRPDAVVAAPGFNRGTVPRGTLTRFGPMITGDGAVKPPMQNEDVWIDPDEGHHHGFGLTPLGKERMRLHFMDILKDSLWREEAKELDASIKQQQDRIKEALDELRRTNPMAFADHMNKPFQEIDFGVPRGTKRVFFHLNDTKGEPVRDAYEVMNPVDLSKIKYMIRNSVLYTMRTMTTVGDITRVEFQQEDPATYLAWWN